MMTAQKVYHLNMSLFFFPQRRYPVRLDTVDEAIDFDEPSREDGKVGRAVECLSDLQGISPEALEEQPLLPPETERVKFLIETAARGVGSEASGVCRAGSPVKPDE